MDHDVQYDGKTVWVHSSDGFTVARFGTRGIDVHLPDASGCLECTHGPTDLKAWERFVEACGEHYGCEIPPEATPDRFR